MDPITVAMVASVSLSLIIFVISSVNELIRIRQKKKEPTLQDKISELTGNLKTSVSVIAEIEKEISDKYEEWKQIEENIERNKQIKEISEAQIEAIIKTMEIPIKKESRRSLIQNSVITFIIAAAFFFLGYFLGSR